MKKVVWKDIFVFILFFFIIYFFGFIDFVFFWFYITLYSLIFYLFYFLYKKFKKKEFVNYKTYFLNFLRKISFVIVIVGFFIFAFGYYQNYISPVKMSEVTITNGDKIVVLGLIGKNVC